MSQTSQTDRFSSFWVAWAVVMILIVAFEGPRWLSPETRTDALTGWICGPQADWLPFLPIFLAGLVMRQIRGRAISPASRPVEPDYPSTTTSASSIPTLVDAAISLLLGGFAIAVTAWTGWDMRDLPPAYHDEFSYLFQALTFLDGQTSYPSFAAMPQLFDQMHVLNEGRFASRYFPGAGVWFALFHGIGAIHGVWLAQGIVATGASIVAGEIAGRAARIVTGLSVVFSPGLCLFSQLYLAHMPTLVGLTVFLVAFLRLRRSCDQSVDAPLGKWPRLSVDGSSLLAGCGLSYAMLCRPMTAAGIGLPFGIWLFIWAFRQSRSSRNARPNHSAPVAAFSPSPMKTLLLIGLPIAAGITAELFYNRSITGNPLTSPYQLYTDIYTPRHVFGFDNVVRGEQHLGPKVLDNYDRWAENLTPVLAIKKMGIRIVASGRWTLGLVPMVVVTALLLWNWRSWSKDVRLIAASIASLHLVHLPYWFEGIMGWHYVFESAPLWSILLGVTTAEFWRQSRVAGHRGLSGWWGGVLLTSVCVAWLTITPLWPGRLPQGLAEVRFPRMAYARFHEQLSERIQGRGIVFIRSNPSDRHLDYVSNQPPLDAAVLRARAPHSDLDLQQAITLFPDREAWLYDATAGSWTLLRRAER